MAKYILTINPGSTSTKIALFEDDKEYFEKTLRHSMEEISEYKSIIDQYQFRKDAILDALREHNISTSDISLIVGRGGLLRPISSGVYEVNEDMIADLSSAKYGEHASNLGGIIANAMAKEIGGDTRAFIADPVVVDELEDVARISGHPMFPKVSVFHALNQKAIAKQYASEISREYTDLNLIVTHLGGGVSVGAHKKGLVVDVNNAIYGDGPFSPERSGALTAMTLVDICFSGEYSKVDVKKMISGKGGMVAHLGTNSFQDVKKMVEQGDAKAKLIADAFIYNIGKEIGAKAAVLSGKVDAILITGGIAYNQKEMEQLASMIDFIAPVKIYPGEDEMRALAYSGLLVLENKQELKKY